MEFLMFEGKSLILAEAGIHIALAGNMGRCRHGCLDSACASLGWNDLIGYGVSRSRFNP